MKFRIYHTSHKPPKPREFRWRLIAINGKIIAVSGESYKRKADCLAAIELVRDTNMGTPTEDLTKGVSK